jgi:hypothetical protein
MTQQRVYNTNAERQAAYRKRLEGRQRSGVAAGFALPTTAGYARWNKAVRSTFALLEIVRDEMRLYYEQRSDGWREGERGEAFQERLDALAEVVDQIGELI